MYYFFFSYPYWQSFPVFQWRIRFILQNPDPLKNNTAPDPTKNILQDFCSKSRVLVNRKCNFTLKIIFFKCKKREQNNKFWVFFVFSEVMPGSESIKKQTKNESLNPNRRKIVQILHLCRHASLAYSYENIILLFLCFCNMIIRLFLTVRWLMA